MEENKNNNHPSAAPNYQNPQQPYSNSPLYPNQQMYPNQQAYPNRQPYPGTQSYTNGQPYPNQSYNQGQQFNPNNQPYQSQQQPNMQPLVDNFVAKPKKKGRIAILITIILLLAISVTVTLLLIGRKPKEEEKDYSPTKGLEYTFDQNGFYQVCGIGSADDEKIVVIPAEHNGIRVASIADAAFRGNDVIEEVIIPDTVVSIGYQAFSNCYALKKVSIPATVTNLDHDIFSGSISLRKIEVAEGNPYYKSIDGNLYTKDGGELILYARGKSEQSFAIPEGVMVIRPSAFAGCNRLETVIIPFGVSEIQSYTFYECKSLKVISIPYTVKAIGYYAFSRCDSINEVYYAGDMQSWLNIINADYATVPELMRAEVHYYCTIK